MHLNEKREKKRKMTINCGTGLLWGHREQGAACALCRRILCAPILIHEFLFYLEPTYSKNLSVWCVTTNYIVRKENQALCNEIEKLTNKLQKVSDDLTKNQQGRHGKRVLFILSCNLQSFVIVKGYCYVIHVIVLPRQTIQLAKPGKLSNSCLQRLKLLLLLLLLLLSHEWHRARWIKHNSDMTPWSTD